MRTLRSGEEQFVGGNSAQFLSEPAEALREMLLAIEQSQQLIALEMYWLADDQVGGRFLNSLIQAAQRGVRVLVIYDAIGSWATGEQCFARLREAGGEVLPFGAIRSLLRRLHFSKLSRRDHRKLLLVDQTFAFVGGVNLANSWASKLSGGKGWRDEVVRVSGPILTDLSRIYFQTYHRIGGAWTPLPHPSPAPTGTHLVAALTQDGFRSRRATLRTYLRRIQAAKKRIFLASAYFVPTSRLTRALIQAASRGVEVTLLLPFQSDIPVIRHASRFTWDRLLRAGIQIYEFRQSILHSKTAVIDGEWCTVGSFNFDHMSYHRNQELNLSVLDKEFSLEVEHSFQSALAQSTQVTLHSFRARSTLSRCVEKVAYGLRNWL